MVADYGSRERIAAFLTPSGSPLDSSGVVFDESLGVIQLAIDNNTSIRINCGPKSDKRIGVTKVDTEVSRPFSWDRKFVNNVSCSFPCVFIYHSFCCGPQSTAQSQITYTCQRVQDGDIARALSRHDFVLIEEQRIILVPALQHDRLVVACPLLQPVRRRIRVAITHELRIGVLAIAQPGCQ